MIGFIDVLLSMFAMGMMQLVLATALPYIYNWWPNPIHFAKDETIYKLINIRI
ncbi:hypothetical protein ACUH7Y_10725 [Clostridium beijerinckii]|uniref:Uncharacterized protein n=1 Tax=Clostridium beijerinckii TaxID=1520 RepID=A0A7X9XR54_CLOBE|nr:hypothetical protein [Clostridium beijerinckii]NMF06661.1 hypothetical protein [Clostridium beijerinckii]NRT71184.1 preprotein translocase subunit Sec63 [Clostridium beijerinckii]